MRKILTGLLAAAVILSTLTPLGSSFATSNSGSSSLAGSQTTSIAIAPTKIALKHYLPVREVFSRLGYQVNWVKESATVTIDSKGKQLLIRSEDVYFLKEGYLKRAKLAPIQHKGKLMIPVSTAQMIFQQVTSSSEGHYKLTKTFLPETAKLPKLNSKFEYEKLLSFYPKQPQVYFSMREEALAAPATEAVGKDAATGSAESNDFSQTNNQVAGVDEADFVKSDGNYLYTIKNDKVQIFKLGREQLSLHHSIQDPKVQPLELFITKDYLIVIGNTVNRATQIDTTPGRIGIMPIYQDQLTSIQLYRMQDLQAKVTNSVMQYAVPGNLTAARLIGDKIYLVSNQYTYYGPMLEPAYFQDLGGKDLEKKTLAFKNMAYFPGRVADSAMYTVGIDLANLTESGLHVESYLGGGYTAYASQNSLYLAGSTYGGMWWRQSDHLTDLYAFDLAAGKIIFRAKGQVKGDLLNQFSMDAHEGHFRVATTSWTLAPASGTPDTTNDLYIFDAALKPVGSLTGLAPGERIYSTRFMGDKLYMVTYRQVDPFYVIDVANPAKPEVLGYLKIPGYSSYLHPYDEKTIIGIGMETKDIGDRVVNAGVKISLFDISDLKNPIEKDKLIIGTGNSYTDVSWDHKAFLFNKAKNILALPIQAEINSGLWNTKDAYIVSFTKEGMLNLRGKISHSSSTPGQAPSADYWEEQINRILYVGSDLYTLSNKWLQLNDFNTLEAIKAIKR